MTKKDLRKIYMQKRSTLTPEERAAMSQKITDELIAMEALWQFKTFHIFLTIRKLKEKDTAPLIAFMQKKNRQIVVPRMNPQTKNIDSVLLTNDTVLETNAWGIDEPKGGKIISPDKIDVVFVPLLACDYRGNRIGYGGGYYDRFLAQCKPDVLKIGLSFFPPETDLSPFMTEKDIRVSLVCTP